MDYQALGYSFLVEYKKVRKTRLQMHSLEDWRALMICLMTCLW